MYVHCLYWASFVIVFLFMYTEDGETDAVLCPIFSF